ncbi:hypothetical protein TWF788_007968 [Orbilia oligospora]|uniref:Uncharacterized protein n=1 Tax=Orbilia oligospora TaxID=2813651 RepID=A0A7C8PPF4_ORBOL|nr:hypothetical protein TWF788_007968 [Orbilia oligospora]KAF3218937.1 hypothetical protein TWF679_000349 [Orbilia oligospora]
MDESRPPTNFHLVLCGAYKARADSWFFGDFVGLCNLLKESGVGGDFVSCYPIDEYFADPRTPDSIKFGTFRDTTAATVTYTKRQHEMRAPFYEQIEKERIKGYLLDWLMEKSLNAQSGDAVSVWILSHGNHKGLGLGGELLKPSELVKATEEFNDGVQVNIAFSACHSSLFAKTYSECPQTFRYIQCAAEELSWAHHPTGTLRRRNSRFIQAMASSLTGERLTRQGYHYRAGPWNISKHENYIKDQVQRKVSDPKEVSVPSFFKDGLNLNSIVKNVLFRDFKDITYNPSTVSRRGRREWPGREDSVVTRLDGIRNYASSGPARERAAARMKTLFAPFAAQGRKAGVVHCDWGFEESATASWADDTAEVNCAVYATYLRARLQSAIWDIIFSLSLDGYLDITKVFVHPVPLNCSEKESRAFVQYLGTLKAISDLEESISLWPHEISSYFTSFVTLLIKWFAIVVLRGMTVPAIDIFKYILDSEWLGDADEEDLEEAEKTYAEDMADKSMPDINKVETNVNLVGFFLPKQPVPDCGSADSLSFLGKLNEDFVKTFAEFEEFTKAYFNWDNQIVALMGEDPWAKQLAKVKELIPLEVCLEEM